MAGHLGDKACTVQRLQIVRIDAERQLILVKGAVPGSPGRDVVVRPTVKPRKVTVAAPAKKADTKAPGRK